MTNQELIEAIEKIQNGLPKDSGKATSVLEEVCFLQTIQFVKTYIGTETEFYAKLESLKASTMNSSRDTGERCFISNCVLEAIKQYLRNDLEFWQTTEYKVKNDIVSDLLQQANELLEDRKVHPAAPAILIGAVLEEFLRMLSDRNGIDLPTNKSSINDYSQELYRIDVISKQDMKDINVWSGLRNDATHGHFEEVNDRKRVNLTLEGVNLFIRKFSPNV